MTKVKSNTTKETILKTAGRLFSQRGYFGVSMQDMADESGITKAAIYYHFSSKEVLTQELLHETVNELKHVLEQSCKAGKLPSDKVFNVIKAFLDFKIQHPELSLLVSLGFTSDEKEPMVQFIQDLRIELTRFIRQLIGGVDFTRRVTYKSVFFITGSLLGLVLSPFQDKNSKSVAHDFTTLLLSGAGEIGEKKTAA